MDNSLEAHLDYQILGTLQEVMEGEYPLLLDTFLSDAQQRLEELHEATGAGDLMQLAHSFKGSSGNMGALRLAELCRQLEVRAAQSPLLDVGDLLGNIDREYQVVQRLYRAERGRFPA